MRIEQLRQVIEVHKTGSINRASQNLFLAQSSISSSIKALEHELGQDIFIRTQHGAELSQFGDIFVEHAKEIIRQIGAIELASSEGIKKGISSPYLSIAVYYLMFAAYPLTQLCNKYKNKEFGFTYLEKNRSNIVSTIAAGEAEIGLLMMYSVRKEKWLSYFRSQGIEYFSLTIEQPHVIVGPGSEFFNESYTTVTPKMLVNRKMVIISEDGQLFQSIDYEIFKKFSPASFLRVCDRGTLISMLNHTNGYYVATYNRKAYSMVNFYKDIKALSLTEAGFTCEIGYIKLQDHALSRIAQEYLQMIIDLIA